MGYLELSVLSRGVQPQIDHRTLSDYSGNNAQKYAQRHRAGQIAAGFKTQVTTGYRGNQRMIVNFISALLDHLCYLWVVGVLFDRVG